MLLCRKSKQTFPLKGMMQTSNNYAQRENHSISKDVIETQLSGHAQPMVPPLDAQNIIATFWLHYLRKLYFPKVWI